MDQFFFFFTLLIHSIVWNIFNYMLHSLEALMIVVCHHLIAKYWDPSFTPNATWKGNIRVYDEAKLLLPFLFRAAGIIHIFKLFKMERVSR